MAKNIFRLLLIIVVFSTNAQKQFGNEWINNNQDLYKITIAEKGVYRISYDDLRKVLFPVDNVILQNIQMFHHGKQVPILIVGDEDGVFNPQDFIEFYAEGNNGEQDSLLYRPENARMNPYHSLYANETAYFLTLGSTPKRTKVRENTAFNSSLIEPYHLDQQVRAFNEQYSFNNSIGYPPFVMQSYYEEGEGWTGKIIVSDSLARFPLKLENYIPQKDNAPILECLFNGRTEITHDVTIALQNNQNQLRTIGKIDYYGFAPLKIVTKIGSNEISDDGVIQLRSQSSKKENVEWHSLTYHKISYPQSFDMLNKTSKYFYLIPKSTAERHVSITNAPQNVTVYQLYDRYNYQKISFLSSGKQLSFVLDNTYSSKCFFVSGEFKKTISIQKISPSLSYTKASNYLIITHPTLIQSAQEFANYRASSTGGNFQTNVVNIQDLYLNFAYGERTPLAIRRFVDYQLSKGQKIDYLFLLGRGKSFPDALKTDASLDLVPTIGYPGSDILFTAGLNDFDIDVQAVPTGRLNVSTNQGILNYLQKVKEYEANTDDLLWKKNILHLNGGLSKTEINYFKGILQGIEPKIKNSFLSGNVEVISKKTDRNIENVDISSEVNKGVGMVSFIGHSSSTTTDLNIGYASSFNNKLQNKPKYPLMYFNGCGVGNVFNKYDLLTTDWLLTPNKGAIAILANSFWSYDFPTNRYLNNLYEKLFEDPKTSGESIGRIQQEVNRKIKSEGVDLFMLSNIHQLVLQGDPALKIFPLKNPDYQVEKVFLQSQKQSLPIAANDSVLVGIIASNFGKNVPSIINVSVKKYTSGVSQIQKFSINNIAYQDTLYLPIKKDINLQSIEVMIDPDNVIVENNESNNEKELKIDWTKANIFTVYPNDALPDQLNPLLDVYFDEKRLKQEDYVPVNAIIKMILSDENPLFLSDTSTISAFLKLCETCDFQRIAFENINFTQVAVNTIEGKYILPNLPKGKYKLLVNGQDTQQNSVGNSYEMTFLIADEQRPITLLTYPNPAEDFCNLQFQIVNQTNPKSGVVRLYDANAKLVDELLFSPKVGKNEVFLNLKNKISSGMYYYKAIIEWTDKKIEEFDGKIIVK